MVHLVKRSLRLPRAALAVLAVGVLWSVFSLVLANDGNAPSRVLVPIARQHYYVAQALFVLPLLALQWAVCSLVSFRVARALGGGGSFGATLERLGFALALPLLLLFLLPDVVCYALSGFSSLGKLVRVTGPLTFVVTLWAATRALRRVHGLSRSRALAAACAGVLAQAALGAPFLR